MFCSVPHVATNIAGGFAPLFTIIAAVDMIAISKSDVLVLSNDSFQIGRAGGVAAAPPFAATASASRSCPLPSPSRWPGAPPIPLELPSTSSRLPGSGQSPPGYRIADCRHVSCFCQIAAAFWPISSLLSTWLRQECSITLQIRVLSALILELQLLWADGKWRAFIARQITTTQKSNHPTQQVPHVADTCPNCAQEQQQHHPNYQPNVRLPRFQRKEPRSKLNTCRIISFPPTPVVHPFAFCFFFSRTILIFSISIQNKYWERWAVVVPMDKVRQQRAFLPLSWAYISIFWG